MVRKYGAILVLLVTLVVRGGADELPIRIDSSRNGEVYVRVVGEGLAFHKLSDTTPTSYPAKPGQRIDVRVIAQDGFLWTWSGTRQGATGPSNITVRLERSPAWGRLLPAGAGLLLLAALGVLKWRRRTEETIAAIEKRARVAEAGSGIPKKIGDYRILSELGEGGMAHVYHAQDEHGVDYAVKVPKTIDERFVRECNIASKLNSPHIVRGFDFQAERSDELPAYLVQEFLVGETLEQKLRGTKGLPLEQVFTLFGQLLNGLEVAHDESIIHRDLKPENIFLDRSRGSEVLKILDFGVARADDSLQLTAAEEIVGTALYASPEQNLSEAVDHRSDLYSMGLILFEMATGQRAWKANSRAELVKQYRAGLPTEPATLRSDLPQEWNRLICDLLEVDPVRRPSSVAAVRERWSRP